jgi:hypothetical protein
MPVDLPLQEMSLPEKLELFEALWADLSRVPEQFQSPEWHEEILKERRQSVESGGDKFSDWEVAKQDIRNRVR